MIVSTTNPRTHSFNNIFDELFGTVSTSRQMETMQKRTPVNIIETDNGYTLEFSAPGRNKENFKISFENGLLNVSYEKPSASDTTNSQKFVRKEFVNENFKRTFNLDEKMNVEGIEAKYENGILNILIPKKEEVKLVPKEISIQ